MSCELILPDNFPFYRIIQHISLGSSRVASVLDMENHITCIHTLTLHSSASEACKHNKWAQLTSFGGWNLGKHVWTLGTSWFRWSDVDVAQDSTLRSCKNKPPKPQLQGLPQQQVNWPGKWSPQEHPSPESALHQRLFEQPIMGWGVGRHEHTKRNPKWSRMPWLDLHVSLVASESSMHR